MIRTIETPQTPSVDEYALVATFSEQSLTALTRIQKQLSDILGDTIWLTPHAALHSTLMEIICDTDYGVTPRQDIFEKWYAAYNHTVAETLAAIPPFEITFSHLEVSQRAIIVRLTHSGAFNNIRARLLANISLPTGTKMPPDITHCSLARFNTPSDLPQVRNKTQTIPVNVTETVTQFQLLKNLGPPTFKPELIQTYVLSV